MSQTQYPLRDVALMNRAWRVGLGIRLGLDSFKNVSRIYVRFTTFDFISHPAYIAVCPRQPPRRAGSSAFLLCVLSLIRGPRAEGTHWRVAPRAIHARRRVRRQSAARPAHSSSRSFE